MRQVAAASPPTGWKTQPVAGSQASAVQGSPSLQAMGALGEQVPVAGSQTLAVWHASVESQTTGFAPTQVPPTQMSVCVQASPSLHAVRSGFAVASHRPAPSLQVPWLHWSAKAEQSRAVPPHTPALQASFTVQKMPSSQAKPSGWFGLEQMPLAGSQLPATWH